MEKFKRRQILFSLIISLFPLFFWNCSSVRKPVREIPKTSPPAAEQKPVQEEKSAEKPPPPVEERKEEAVEEKFNQEELTSQEKREPSDLLEEALEVYQDALTAWEKGDLDTALAVLDDAYGLLLRIKLPPDSPLFQDKNDLRLLIAQRIQEIYASLRSAVSDNHKTIPLVENEHVLAEIKSFQTKEREEFEAAYRRSGLYREMILEEIKKEGLPEQLSWLPLIESWFKVRAYSNARALGLWQFIPSTGYRFGLRRDRFVDDRMDPAKSTQAALKYLSELHSLFGDWTTALAAYNCGEFRVQRVIRSQRLKYLDNFWDLYKMLPRETARFTPRFIAALLIINDPKKYGFNLPESAAPLRFETITSNHPFQVSELAGRLGLGAEELADLNPELRYKSTPDEECQLRVPVGYGEKALAAINTLPRWLPPEATYVIHYVRRGETVSGIASRYGTTLSAIARLNQLGRNYLIRPGQRLKIPGRGASVNVSAKTRQLLKEGEKLIYVVKRGDSLYIIANAFNTTVQKIKQENNLSGDLLAVGQKLVIESTQREGAVIYTVQAGDSPIQIAKKFGMSLSVLLSLNDLNSRSKIYPGQKLWVTPKSENSRQ